MRFVLLLLFIAFSIFNSLAQTKLSKIQYLNFDDAQPVIAASGTETPAELTNLAGPEGKKAWDIWVQKADQSIRARLEQGDEDSIVNLLLFGTSFTKQPRLTENQISRLAKERAQDVSQIFQSIAQARFDDFANALGKPQKDERLAFAKSYIVKRLKTDLNTDNGKNAVKTFMALAFQRVVNESKGFSDLLEQARRNKLDTFVVRSQLFNKRGLSSDTSLKPNLAIEKALVELKAKGLVSKIQRVAIIGPGLDFTDKEEGYDFYPPQTIQPFAVIESIKKLNLGDIAQLKIDTYDLSPKVNSHISNFTEKAKRKEIYTILLPLDMDKVFTPDFLDYWQNFGSQIALPNGKTSTENDLKLNFRTVSIRTEFLSKIHAFDTNIVLQSPSIPESERYDLVIGTNIFLYYSPFEQGLAMRNLNKMIKNGGILLSNNALIEFPFTPIHSVGYSKAIYTNRPGDADAIVWYQKK